MDKAKRDARRRELAEKKKRLEELRRLKAERAAASTSSKPPAAALPPTAPAVAVPDPPGGLDNFIEELLSKPVPGEKAAQGPAAASSGGVQTDSVTREVAAAGPSAADLRAERYARLVVTRGPEVHVGARPLEMYHKGVQTDEEETPQPETPRHRRSPSHASTASEHTAVPSRGTAGEVDGPTSLGGATADTVAESTNILPPALAPDEREVVEAEDGYAAFLSRSVRVLERALQQSELFDVTFDYSSNEAAESAQQKDRVSFSFELTDERYTKGRAVTDLRWSTHYKELFLAAYSKPAGQTQGLWQHHSRGYASEAPDGVVLLWSTHLRDEPEFVFTAQSTVLTAAFDPFTPNLVLGGTYSGQVVVWDMRAKSVPVQRSLMPV